jgi:hypothetical protein
MAGPDIPKDFKAVLSRHHIVKDDKIRYFSIDHVNGIQPVKNIRHLELMLFQIFGQEFDQFDIIVNDQNILIHEPILFVSFTSDLQFFTSRKNLIYYFPLSLDHPGKGS